MRKSDRNYEALIKDFEFICWTEYLNAAQNLLNVIFIIKSKSISQPFYYALLRKFLHILKHWKMNRLVGRLKLRCINFLPQMHIWIFDYQFWLFINLKSNLFIIAKILISGRSSSWTCIFNLVYNCSEYFLLQLEILYKVCSMKDTPAFRT
jgi:hypothetical protein